MSKFYIECCSQPHSVPSNCKSQHLLYRNGTWKTLSQLQRNVERELHVKKQPSDNKEVWSDFPDILNAKLHKATAKIKKLRGFNFKFSLSKHAPSIESDCDTQEQFCALLACVLRHTRSSHFSAVLVHLWVSRRMEIVISLPYSLLECCSHTENCYLENHTRSPRCTKKAWFTSWTEVQNISLPTTDLILRHRFL